MSDFDTNLFYESQLKNENLIWKVHKGGTPGEEVLRGIVENTQISVAISHNYSGLAGMSSNIAGVVNGLSGTMNNLGSDVILGDAAASTVVKAGDKLFDKGDKADYDSAVDAIKAFANKYNLRVNSDTGELVTQLGLKGEALKEYKSLVEKKRAASRSINDRKNRINSSGISGYIPKALKDIGATLGGNDGVLDSMTDYADKLTGTKLLDDLKSHAEQMFGRGGQLITTFDSIKVYRGTAIDMAIPQISTRIYHGVGVVGDKSRVEVIPSLEYLIDIFGGDHEGVVTAQESQVIGMQLPPLDYKPNFASIGDGYKNKTCFSLVYGNHRYYNLICTSFAFQISTIKVREGNSPYNQSITAKPLYADVSISFAKATYPIKEDLKRFIRHE